MQAPSLGATPQKRNAKAALQVPDIPLLPGREETFLSTPAITLRWLLRLRWGAVAGQTATVAGSWLLFRLALPVVPLGFLIAGTALTNLALARMTRPPRTSSPGLVAAVLVFDTLSLGGLLYFTGGPSNPFSALFLVQITIAAAVLGFRYAAVVVALSAAVYALLFFDNVPLAGMEHMHHVGSTAFGLHLQGMFIAFTLAAALIAYFVSKVSTALRERDAQLAGVQRLAATNERLASLSTLAAGAAHELGTPLATIAVASREVERSAEAMAGAEALRDDARLIRQQVERCRDIVQQMSAGAGATLGELAERVEVEHLVAEVGRELDEARAARFDVKAPGGLALHVPRRSLAQTLGSLVKNAFDASDDRGRVTLAVIALEGRVRFAVEDRGRGMTGDELAHVGEPFFTTKAPGSGMGLGVFLARAFADRVGGTLTFDSARGRGTAATLEVPSRGA